MEDTLDPIFLQRVGKDLFGKYGLEPSDITILSEEFGATGRGYYSNPMTGQVYKHDVTADFLPAGLNDAMKSGYSRLFDFYDEILHSAKLKNMGSVSTESPKVSGIDFDFIDIRYLDYEGIPIVASFVCSVQASDKEILRRCPQMSIVSRSANCHQEKGKAT